MKKTPSLWGIKDNYIGFLLRNHMQEKSEIKTEWNTVPKEKNQHKILWTSKITLQKVNEKCSRQRLEELISNKPALQETLK